MGISSVYNTAATALSAQKVAIDIIGENIANVNTPGYSRQQAVLESGPVTVNNGLPLGNGVLISKVQRIYDAVINSQLNESNSSYGNSDARMKALQQVEPYINELSGNTLGDALQKLADSWQSLAQNPTGVAERQTVLGRATIVIDTLHQINDGIRNAQSFSDDSIAGVAVDITTKAREIAAINIEIRHSDIVNGNANELRDKRDNLLQELSKLVGVSSVEQSDGSLSVFLPNGETLVSVDQYAQVYTSKVATTDPNLPASTNRLYVTGLGFPPPVPDPASDTDVTATIGGTNNAKGEIGGLLDIRDKIVPAYLDKLDETAYNLAWQTNQQHAAGWNLNNVTGVDFFSPATTTAPPAGKSVFAGYSSSSATLGITLAISGTNEIAAADQPPAVGGVGNNKNAVLMGKLADQAVSFSGGVESTIASYFNSFVSGVGVDVQDSKNRSTQHENFTLQLTNLRDSIAGVSMDEELTNLIKFQKAYEGASRVINTATEMIDTILSLVR